MSDRAGSGRVDSSPRSGPAPRSTEDRSVAHTVVEARPGEMVVRAERTGDYQFIRGHERIGVRLQAQEDTVLPMDLKPVTDGVRVCHGSRYGYLPRRQWLVGAA